MEMEGVPMFFCAEDISFCGEPLDTGRLRSGIYVTLIENGYDVE
jgi:hypothetical protein